MQQLKSSTQKSAFNSSLKNTSKNILNLLFTILVFCTAFGTALGQGCLPAPAPFLEDFSSGVIPNGVGGINCWSQSASTGDGWRFAGNPGYHVASNGRPAGSYAWIDFSGSDAGAVLQVQEIDVLGSTATTLTFDYYSDDGTYTVSPANQMYVEVLDPLGGNWIVAASYTTHTIGWATQTVDLTGLDAFGILTIRFRGESGGGSNDFYNDILLDNVSVTTTTGGGTGTGCSGIMAPFIENFDGSSLPNCWLQEGLNDNFDWTIDASGTSSSNTGPSDDMTGGGNYLYIETSSPRANGDEAVLYLENVNLSSLVNPELRFYSHMYGIDINTLNVDISTNSGASYSNIFTKSGNQGNQWNEEIVDISSYFGSGTVTFRITGIRGTSWAGDIAIDNFEVREAPSCPQPTVLAASNITETSADISWIGSSSVFAFEIEYGPAGFTPGTGTIVLAPGSPISLSGLTPGTNYEFYVQADCGSGQTSQAGPSAFNTIYPGDNCSNAIDLGGETSPYTNSTSLMTDDLLTSCGPFSVGNDMVFYIDVPDGYVLDIRQSINDYDSRHQLAYGSTCPGQTVIICRDDPDTYQETWTNTTGSTQRVWWLQDAYSTGSGSFTLEWNLSISCPTTYGTDVQQACNSYTWMDGNTYTASNNSATYTMINAEGCDSIVTLDLTINLPTSNSSIETACDSYTWPVNGQTYTSDGVYTDVSTSPDGCTHTETLDLTINFSTNNTTTETACDSYTWSVDGNTYTSSGTYADTSFGSSGSSQIFNYTGSAQTFIVPPGVTEISAVCVGGGGGGSASTLASNGFSGGGGGGGALHWRTLSVTPGTVLTINVGAGGIGGTSAGANDAQSGGESSITIGGNYELRAGGGSAGTYNSASQSSGGSSYYATYGGGGGNGGAG
ncbi:MAG: fibronectin type III domain-containing protein, partial [Saprospiraceae bacterium]|nr:fibronectin type III domain-containing protein [Saprospiraceae bacterium]